MKALSIQQPWAWAILHAGKDVENRSWQMGYRGPLLIHAGKKVDREAIEWIEDLTGLTVPADLQTGGIVGRCEVTGYIYDEGERDLRHCSPWFFGPWGWCLANATPVEFRLYRGQLGLFDVTSGKLERLA